MKFTPFLFILISIINIQESAAKPSSDDRFCGNSSSSLAKASSSNVSIELKRKLEKAHKNLDEDEDENIEKLRIDAEFLKAELVLVEDDKLFMDLWNSTSQNVQLNTIESIDRDKRYFAHLILEGCKKDIRGKCNLSLSFKTLFPNGEMEALGSTEFVLKNTAPPDGQYVSASPVFRINKEEVSGEYTMVARLHDLNANTTFKLKKCYQVR